jgi:mRNA export factor
MSAISHDAPVLCSAWKDDGTTVFSGGCDKTIRTDPLSDDMTQFISERRAAVLENCEINNLLKTISNSVRKSLLQMVCQESYLEYDE